MVDPTKQRGDTGRPMGPEPDKEQEVDPEKFKKVLKVEQTDEAEKRQKRRLKKGQEEGDEDEDVQEKPPAPPSSSFAEFMEDKSELDDLFEAESPGVRKQAAPQSAKQAPAPGSISTEGVELEEEPSSQQQPSPYEPQQPSYGESQEALPSYQEATSQPPTYPTNQSQTDQDERQTSYTEEQQQTQPTEDKSQKQGDQPPSKKEEDASLLASQPAKGALKSKKKPPSKPAPRVETVASKKEEPSGPTPLKEEETPREKQPTEEVPTAKALPQAGEGSIMPTFIEAPPSEEVKGEEATAKPLEAPIAGEAQPLLEPKGVPIPEEGKEELAPGVSGKKGAAVPSTEMPKEAPSRAKPTTQMTFERFSPEQIRDRKMGKPTPLPASTMTPEGIAIPTLPEGDMGMMGEEKKDKKDDFPFLNADQLTVTLPTPEQVLPPVIPPADAPAYSKLSPETYELFEKMVGTIIIQDHSGITSTTVTLNMPNSIFNGAQVTFDRYSSAPNSYNLQLVGTPQAVDAFNANMADLVAAFKQGQHAFEVNILNPSLVSKKPLIRRKGAAGDGGGKNKH